MSVNLGNTSIGSLYLGSTKVGAAYLGNAIVYGDPYNPLGLGYYTMRLKFSQGYTPTEGSISNVLVDAEENIWDCAGGPQGKPQFPYLQFNTYLLACISANMRYTSTTFATSQMNRFSGCSNLVSVSLPCLDQVTTMQQMFQNCTNLTSVSLVDTINCTDMNKMFLGCSSLTTVPLFDTSSCTNMSSMFDGCSSLTTVPLLDTSSCLTMSSMFRSCYNVQSGALALYQQASTQATVPAHTRAFTNCGRDTVTGAAELAQIPTSWGGTMA